PGTTKMRVSVVADAHTARLAVDKARHIAKAQDSDEADEFLTAAAADGSGALPAVEPAIILPADTTIMGTTMDERGNYMLSLT
ncbi:HNH endonuclease, partial [Corynebacterium pyruviciproducens]|nr:HNH endonuclease [Corynebacterium pyruviciproducens]